jgi:hypothetical protein
MSYDGYKECHLSFGKTHDPVDYYDDDYYDEEDYDEEWDEGNVYSSDSTGEQS